jgi:hypothetical protein
VTPKRAVLVTQYVSDRCGQTPAAAGWLRRAASGIRPVFSALVWRRELERLAIARDGGVAGEPAAVTCLVNAGGRWWSRLAAVLLPCKPDRDCRCRRAEQMLTAGKQPARSLVVSSPARAHDHISVYLV